MALQNPIQELLQCAICLGQVSRPRVLPCFHSFCQSCLDTHIRTTSTGRVRAFKFRCPSCRLATEVPSKGADGFPVDFRLNKFSDALKEVASLKKDGICGICPNDEFLRPAKHFCPDCQKYFCEACSLQHHLSPVLSHHFLMDVTAEGQGRGSKCRSHSTEVARYVCSDCEHSVCVLCVLGDHKYHDVSHGDATSSVQRTRLHGNLSHVQEQIWSIHESLFHLTCLEGRLKGMYEETKLQIKRQSRKVVNRILGDENEILRDLEAIYDSKCSDVFKVKERFRGNLTSCESLQANIGSLLRSDNIHELLVKLPALAGEMENAKFYTRVSLPPSLQNFVRFQPGHFLKLGKLLTTDLKQEYTTALTFRQDHRSTDNSTDDSDDDHSANFEDPAVVIVRLLRRSNSDVFETDFDIRRGNVNFDEAAPRNPYGEAELLSVFGGYGHSMGSMRLPYSICFTADDKLLVAENGNRRVQVFDSRGMSMHVIGSGEIIPRSIATTPQGDIAITDELTKTVKVYDLDGNLKRTLRPAGATFPFGLATTSSGDFLFTDMIFENVTVMTSLGILTHQFGSHGCAEDRFDNPGYLAVNSDKIFVSDTGNHAVKVFDMSGQFLYKFGRQGSGDGDLRYPKALCFDDDDRVFVADSGNDRVLVFTNSGQFLGQVVGGRESGLRRPTGLAFSSTTKLLAISIPDENEIRMFKLSFVRGIDTYPDVRL